MRAPAQPNKGPRERNATISVSGFVGCQGGGMDLEGFCGCYDVGVLLLWIVSGF